MPSVVIPGTRMAVAKVPVLRRKRQISCASTRRLL